MSKSDLELIQLGLVVMYRLREAVLDGDVEWLVPPTVLAGVTQAYGRPVRHVQGIVYLGHRIDLAPVAD